MLFNWTDLIDLNTISTNYVDDETIPLLFQIVFKLKMLYSQNVCNFLKTTNQINDAAVHTMALICNDTPSQLLQQ